MDTCKEAINPASVRREAHQAGEEHHSLKPINSLIENTLHEYIPPQLHQYTINLTS